VTEIQPFTFPTTGHSVRTLLVDGEPWFIASDVGAVLELGNVHSSLGLLDEDEKGLHSMETPSGPQRFVTVNEPGLYSLILRSRKPEAKAFKRWVTHEVLPSIRKTGSYSAPVQPMDELELAQHNVRLILEKRQAQERAIRAEHQVLELAPAAHAWDELAEATGDYSVREAAQILDRDPSIQTGQKRLFDYLRSIGWLDRHNQPYQRHMDCGRMTVRARSYEHPHRDELVATQQVRITAKGLGELHRLLGGGAQFQALMSEELAA
jgi:anti-repressor protein